MSVVNQMLRDLDRRRGSENAAVYGQHLQTASGGSWRKAMIVIGLFILLALIALIYLLLPQTQQTPPVAVQPPPQKIVAAPVAEAPVPQAMPEEKPAVPAAEPLVLPPPAPAPAPAPAPVVEAPPPPKKAVAPAPPPTVIAAPAEPKPAAAQVQSGPTKIDVRPSTPARTAESEFKRAVALINQGRGDEARTALGEALKLDARHEGARQTLAVMQMEAGLHEEAQAVLNEGLKLNPAQSNFALLLARMKVERGDTAGGLEVLRQYAAPAANNAQYRAFTAALLQRLERHSEAIEEYQAALKLAPNMAVWWMGLGLSYEAAGQTRDAAEAFGRARISGTLSPELNEFVERKLQTLR